MENCFEFEKEFMTDDEVEAMLENLLDFVGGQAEEQDNRNAVLNIPKAKILMCTYKILKHLTKGSGAKVSYELNSPYKSMGSVSVVGKNISFKNSKLFTTAANLASNFNVYPKTNGTVQMDFTFHGLTIPLD